MHNDKIEKLKNYIMSFYKSEIAFIEEDGDCLIIRVVIFNQEHKKASKLTCMEQLEKYEVVGVEDIDYSSIFII